MEENKISEWRPPQCGTRLGDFVMSGKTVTLKVKCRKCSKRLGRDTFHHLNITLDAFSQHGQDSR